MDRSIKTAVITGANSGIGKETTKALLKAGCRVIMLCRTESTAQQVAEELLALFPAATLSYVLADLSDMKQVIQAAQEIQKQTDQIDILVNNAGVMLNTREQTIDGFEKTIAVNHFAYFLLTDRLLPLLRKAGTAAGCARIVNVASRAHKRSSIDFDDLMFERRRYISFVAYCQSKLANVLYTRELASRLTGEYITVNCLHPGVVNTGFLRNTSGVLGRLMKLFFSFQLTPEEGAQTSIFLALDPSVEGNSGGYYADCRQISSSKEGANMEIAKRLWEYTEDRLRGGDE